MGGHITRKKQAEEIELEKKFAELESLTDQLADSELDLATFRRDLIQFEARYIGAVGVLYAELDGLEAAYAERVAERVPDDEVLQDRVEETRRRADETARATAQRPDSDEEASGPASKELKDLFKEAAKAVHPDRAIDAENRQKREKFMARVNDAYERGDSEAIRQILDEWEGSPDAVKGEGVGADLVRVIRLIEQVRMRIEEIELELAELRASSLAELMLKCREAEENGEDLLGNMKESLEARVREVRSRIDGLEGVA